MRRRTLTSAAFALLGLCPLSSARADRQAAPRPPVCAQPAGVPARRTVAWAEDTWRRIPIDHVIVLMQENRSFDHYFGRLPQAGHTDVDGLPDGAANINLAGLPIAAHHLGATCVDTDPPHHWEAMHAQWNEGRMDNFVRVPMLSGQSGEVPMGYYDQDDLPFDYWLAKTFAISDRHFAAAMSGTWHNRQFLYAGTSRLGGPEGQLRHAPTVFDQLDARGVSWAVYTDGNPRQDCLGWSRAHAGVAPTPRFFQALASGILPAVTFLDPDEADEHPPNDIQKGEAWLRQIYLALRASPLWVRTALVLTYDESGGFYDHVPPPEACSPADDRPEFNRMGARIPLIVISPWAKPHHVSHTVTDHASVLKLIELLFDLPTLSRRDANADGLLSLFDFSTPRLLSPGVPPQAGTGGCARTPAAAAQLTVPDTSAISAPVPSSRARGRAR